MIDQREIGRPQKNRAPPEHIWDVCNFQGDEGGDDLNDENLINFCLFSDCDPISCEQALKEEK